MMWLFDRLHNYRQLGPGTTARLIQREGARKES